MAQELRPEAGRRKRAKIERHFKVHDGKPDAWRLCGSCAAGRIGVVSGLRHGRSGELRSCDIQHAVPPWLDLETAHGNCRHGAVGTRQAGSGFTGAEVLPGIPAEAVACHHTATLGKPWRIRSYNVPNSPTPYPNPIRGGQHPSLRQWDRGRAEVLRERSPGGAAWDALQLLHPGLHGRRMRN